VYQEIKKNFLLYVLSLPGLLFLIIFAYIPMSGHIIAFKKFTIQKGIFGSDWSGFDNFKFFFQGDAWIKVTYNTVFLNSFFIVFGLGTAVVLALLINEMRTILFRRLTQSLIFMPYFISWMVVSIMVFAVLNTTDGLLNRNLQHLGLNSVSWYSSPEYWPFILTLIYVWKMAGYFSIIFLAAITSISTEFYESARIDGATRFQQIVHITLPLIRPTIIILGLLAVGRIFYGDFGMIYGIVGDNGTLLPTTDVIDTYSYRALRTLGNFGMSSAVVLYQSVLGLISIVLFNLLAKRIEKDSALF
jgi:putative aldouronate transport system permease protein